MPKDNPKDNTLIGHIDQQVNGDLEKVEFILKSKSRLEMVGLPGFEPESIEPKSTSQTLVNPKHLGFCCLF